MAEARTAIANKPVWVDLSSHDAEGSREFYGKLFGWDIEVNSDPQYGGYGMAKVGGKDVAGIGPKMDPNAPTAWNLYIGAPDAGEVAARVEKAGGTVVMAPFDVGDQGKMAVFQSPDGAYICAWQPARMEGFPQGTANTYCWAELNSRDLDKALPFYSTVFGWDTEKSPMGEGMPPYTQFKLDGESIGGAWPMNEQVPAEVPSYWMIYIGVADLDASHQKALDLGATEMMPPTPFPGGRFSILTDPQGASFGLLTLPES